MLTKNLFGSPRLNFIPHCVLEFDTLDLKAVFLRVGGAESYRGEHKRVTGWEEKVMPSGSNIYQNLFHNRKTNKKCEVSV